MKRIFLAVLAILLCSAGAFAQQPTSWQQEPLTRVAGRFVASSYNAWQTSIITGNSVTGGSSSITVAPAFVTLADGRTINPFGAGVLIPITVIDAGVETVTPTAISTSTCPSYVSGPVNAQCATITATFANFHGQGAHVVSGTYGLQEAIDDAYFSGGGLVELDNTWAGTNAMITAAVVLPTVAIEDVRGGVARMWTPTPTGAALAVPTTLSGQAACDSTHQFCSDATVAGSASYAGGALYGCVAYVDIMGNEGPCSLTNTFTDVSTKAIDVAAPVASPGAVGYVVYLSLDAGTYAQAYQIPSTSSNCTLTTLETILPACAVANATYNQAASTFGKAGLFTVGGSQIATYPVTSGMHFTKIGSIAMTAASQTPISNSSLTYSYAPSNRVGAPGISSANVSSYAASGSSATLIPNAIATWTIPASYFNYIGAEFRVKGKYTVTAGTSDSSTNVYVKWDAAGTNTTTVGTTLCNILTTSTIAGATNGTYECTVKIATAGATGTALGSGTSNSMTVAGAAGFGGTDVAVAVTGSINLTVPARISVFFIGTGATNNPGAQGLSASLEVLN